LEECRRFALAVELDDLSKEEVREGRAIETYLLSMVKVLVHLELNDSPLWFTAGVASKQQPE
jgi:hypothetical protein